MLLRHDRLGGWLTVWRWSGWISRHLLSRSPVLSGGTVKSDLRRTYRHVLTQGDGYCGDFADSFVAIAIAMASSLQVRTWAFSFDQFGESGHVWPKLWSRQVGSWQLVEVFNNYYFFEIAAVPLSTLAFQQAMLSGSKQLRLAPLDRGACLGWAIERKAWADYRRGLPARCMGWGNHVFLCERSGSVRLCAGVSRSLAQLGATVEGVHPAIRLLANVDNPAQV